MKIFAQKLLVGRTFLANQTVTVEDGQITAIGGGGPADFSVWALTPGLVDLHCHGGQGFDPELNERPLPEFLTILLCHGVTDVLLTLGAEPLPTMRRALAVVQTAMQQQAAGKLPGAHILGVHLEGPFLSPERPGAMPPAALLPPTLAAYQTLGQGYESVIRQVTLAPELPGALELGAALAARGIGGQAGHTIVPPRPSLVPLEEAGDTCAQMQGLSLRNVTLTLKNQKKKAVFQEQGELLFPPFGLSGPLVLSASAHANWAKETYTAVIDLKPALE